MDYPFSGLIVRYVKSGFEAGPIDPSPKDELHVNLWEMGRNRFIDIGVMINIPEEIEAIQVDLPWELDRTKVFDLGSRLVGERIVAAVFNEIVCYNGSNDHLFADVTFPTIPNSSGFVLARLNSDNFKVEPVLLSEGGTTSKLTVRLPALGAISPQRKFYVRFRIIDVPLKIYTSIFYQKDRNLLSSSLETRIVDFRVNVRRGIPDDVLTSQAALQFPRWRKIHLFLTIDRSREMTFTSENFIACRSLEDEAIWNNYISLNHNNNQGTICSVSDYLGYQWTAKSSAPEAPVKDLVALARFSQVTSSWVNMTRFILLALILGTAGSGIWTALTQYIAPPSDQVAGESATLRILGILTFAFVTVVGLTTATVRRTTLRIGHLFQRFFATGRRALNEDR